MEKAGETASRLDLDRGSSNGLLSGWFPVIGIEPLHLLIVAIAWAAVHSESSSDVRPASG